LLACFATQFSVHQSFVSACGVPEDKKLKLLHCSYLQHSTAPVRDSTVPERTLAAPLPRFLNLFRHSVGLLWTSDQPVAKASICTRQHTTKTRTNIHALSGIGTHDLSAQAIKAYASDRAAAGTDPFHLHYKKKYFWSLVLVQLRRLVIKLHIITVLYHTNAVVRRRRRCLLSSFMDS
jgi:hypothetical protein